MQMAGHPIYVVLELPEPAATAVLTIRRRYDPRLAGFPAEITVAGSSGVGPLMAEQALEPVLECLHSIPAGPYDSGVAVNRMVPLVLAQLQQMHLGKDHDVSIDAGVFECNPSQP